MSERFEGRFHLQTPQGPVAFEGAIEVSEGAGVLKSLRSPAIRQAQAEIDIILSNLVDQNTRPQLRALTDWQERRRKDIDRHGINSIFDLLPSETPTPGKLQRIVNALKIAGFETKEHLANFPDEKISDLPRVGQKFTEVILAMKNLAATQLEDNTYFQESL